MRGIQRVSALHLFAMTQSTTETSSRLVQARALGADKRYAALYLYLLVWRSFPGDKLDDNVLICLCTRCHVTIVTSLLLLQMSKQKYRAGYLSATQVLLSTPILNIVVLCHSKKKKMLKLFEPTCSFKNVTQLVLCLDHPLRGHPQITQQYFGPPRPFLSEQIGNVTLTFLAFIASLVRLWMYSS